MSDAISSRVSTYSACRRTRLSIKVGTSTLSNAAVRRAISKISASISMVLVFSTMVFLRLSLALPSAYWWHGQSLMAKRPGLLRGLEERRRAGAELVEEGRLVGLGGEEV